MGAIDSNGTLFMYHPSTGTYNRYCIVDYNTVEE